MASHCIAVTARFCRLVALASVTAVALWLASCERQGSALPALEAKLDQSSVSGLSSGAYMAGQFQLANASIIVGAGIIAGGPYGCSESLYADAMPGPGTAFLNLSKAINGCMLDALQGFGIPNAKQLAERARYLASKGRIDPIEDVARQRVFLFSGREDRTVVPAIVAAARDFYLAAGIPADQIELVDNLPAGHAFVTDEKGGSCGSSAAPYIVNCRYDLAGAMLKHIYRELTPKGGVAIGDIMTFDQSEFLLGLSHHSMGASGTVYVPAACRSAPGCRIHVAFHGCAQNRAAVGDAFIRDTGLLPWAEANRLIVLFPQAEATAANPQGCWDWWGYTGQDFLTKEGPQILAVRRMLERLAAPRSMI
jgi:poly(3-hydroxybutyrate) depolymerase